MFSSRRYLPASTCNLHHEEPIEKIIGCATKIHRVMGHGFNLAVYKYALAFEMRKLRLDFSPDKELDVFYEGTKTGTVTIDFVIRDISIMADNQPRLDESKALPESFLQAVNMRSGLLLNFGNSKLEFTTTYSYLK